MTWTELLPPSALNDRFPWLQVDEDAELGRPPITLGSLGTQHEGWFDPWSLLNGMRNKAKELGVQYVDGAVSRMNMQGGTPGATTNNSEIPRCIQGVVVTQSDGGPDLEVAAGQVVCAAGAWAGEVVAMCGEADTVTPLPVAPRKRCIFTFHCPEADAPDSNTPLTVLPETGV